MDTPLDDQLLEEIHSDQNTNTGIENKKLIMWLFLASDCMFFGTLISTHLIYRKLYPFGHPEEGAVNITGTFDIELTSFSTFILLMSSFLMALAVSAMHKGSVKSFRLYTLGVIVFGLIFLGGQVYEFQHFYHGQGWYEWTAKSKAGQVIQGSQGNELYFHDVADADEAKENFVHEHLGLKLTSFKPAPGTTADDRPVKFNYEVKLPDSRGVPPQTFYGEYLYQPADPAASQIVVLSEIPEPPAEPAAEKEGTDETGDKASAEENAEQAETGDEASPETSGEETSAGESKPDAGKEDETANKTSAEAGAAQAEDAANPEASPEANGEKPEEHASEEKHASAESHAAHAIPAGPIPGNMSGMKDVARDAFKHKNFGFHLEEFKQVKEVPGLSLQGSVFGSTFYVMTGTHGTHVAIGVLWLFSMLVYSYSGRLTPRNAIDVEIAGLYWHFVDIVWIVIFTAVYLVEYI